MSNAGWIGVDLDGTLAFYVDWVHHANIGEPIRPMVNRVKKWIADGYKVKVFTARMSVEDEAIRSEIAAAIRLWTTRNIGKPLEATCIKDLNMIELWDVRAVGVFHNTGEPSGPSPLGL